MLGLKEKLRICMFLLSDDCDAIFERWDLVVTDDVYLYDDMRYDELRPGLSGRLMMSLMSPAAGYHGYM